VLSPKFHVTLAFAVIDPLVLVNTYVLGEFGEACAVKFGTKSQGLGLVDVTTIESQYSLTHAAVPGMFGFLTLKQTK
jgi:hypothetical protein